MGHYIQIFLIVIVGVLLLWFGFSLFARFFGKDGCSYSPTQKKEKKTSASDYTGEPQTCPVCSAKLTGGDQVNTTAFPAPTGRNDRIMYIKGCIHCLCGERKRVCPVCGKNLSNDDFLAARIYERNFRRSHVHIQGCSICCKIK